MSVVEAIQARLATSKMFVAGEKLETARTKKLKGRKVRELLKVGQGGTLDPLADGVLGEYVLVFYALCSIGQWWE